MPTNALPEFRIRVNGVYMPEINVKRNDADELQLEVRDWELGWITLDDNVAPSGTNGGNWSSLPQFKLEYRDETAWALLPVEVCQASKDKGWNQCTPSELIGILWNTGVLK
jgi:hypothetical protein